MTYSLYLSGIDESASERPKVSAFRGVLAALQSILGDGNVEQGFAVQIVERALSEDRQTFIVSTDDEDAASEALKELFEKSGGVCGGSINPDEIDRDLIYFGPEIVDEENSDDEPVGNAAHTAYILLSVANGAPVGAIRLAARLHSATGCDLFMEAIQELIMAFEIQVVDEEHEPS